jgi:hypothetical protein
MLKCVHDIFGTSDDGIDRGSNRHGELCGKPGERVCITFCAGFFDPDSVTAVRVLGWADVPSIDCMRRPRGSNSGCFVDEDADSWGCNWDAVEVVVAVDLGPGRQFGIDTRATHEI